MGRHTAEIRIPTADEITTDRAGRALPASTPWLPARTPAAGPGAVRAPLAPAARTAVLDRALPAPTEALPVHPAWTPDLLRNHVPPQPEQDRAGLDAATLERIQRDLRTITPSAQALQNRIVDVRPAVPPMPASTPPVRPEGAERTAAADLPSASRADAEAIVDAPTGLEPDPRPSAGFRVGRSLSLALSAVAVLSAVSGAAALLPH
jgi:hypothetical protein